MDRLRDRGVIVTGATGIAGASARRFAAEGARLVVISRTEASCRELVEGIAAEGGRASYVVADLTDASGRRRRRQPRRSSGWAASTGSSTWPAAPVGAWATGRCTRSPRRPSRPRCASTPPATWPSARRSCGPCWPQEPDADGLRGAIVNMGSVLATRPVPELFPTHAYAMAKGAIASLTVASAAYYASSRHPHQHGRAGADHLAHVRARRRGRGHAGLLAAQAAHRRWLHRGRGRGRCRALPALSRVARR